MACCAVAAYLIYRILAFCDQVEAFVPHRNTVQTSVISRSRSSSTSVADKRSCSLRLSLTGLTCTSCTANIHKALVACDGVETVHMSPELLQAYVTFDPKATQEERLTSAVTEAGYGASVAPSSSTCRSMVQDAENRRQVEIDSWRFAFVSSAILAGPTFVLPYLPPMLGQTEANIWLSQAAIAAAVVIFCAFEIHREAIRALAYGRATMSLLSSLGIVLDFVQCMVVPNSAYGPGDNSLSFGPLVTFTTVVIGGRLLKSVLLRWSYGSLSQMASAIPTNAVVVQSMSEDLISDTIVIPVDLSAAGDMLLVEPYSPIPGDGKIIRGTSSVLETCRTGELLPVFKQPGDMVYTGTVNQERSLVVRLTCGYRDNWLERTLQSSVKGEQEKCSSSCFTDLFSEFFVVTVLSLTSLVILYSRLSARLDWSVCLVRSASMLSSACPCAIGLARPICGAVARVLASRKQIVLSERGHAMESAGLIKTVLFDKTGTLTTGELFAHDVQLNGNWILSPTDRIWLWSAVRLLEEQQSGHPVAYMLLRESERQLAQTIADSGLEVPEMLLVSWESHSSLGLTGTICRDGQDMPVVVGSIRLLQAMMDLGPEVAQLEATAHSAHLNIVFVAVDGVLACHITYSDPIRADASATVRDLLSSGLHVGLVTGDTPIAAQSVATALNIAPEWTFSCQRPDEKLALVRRLEGTSGPVAMVGDNLNDIPALCAASLSVSVTSSHQDVSPLHSDAYLTPALDPYHDLLRIPYLLRLARARSDRVLMLEHWAIVYNIIALFLSSGILQGWHPFLYIGPTTSSSMMAVNSALVLLMSRRLEHCVS